jgi:uncharacterized protein (DUF927 family)
MSEITVTPAEAIQMGWSIMPANRNKKSMLPSWKEYQQRRPTEDELREWIKWNPPAWAVITGAISSRLSLDFDGDQGKRTLERLHIDAHRRTPAGGYHADFAHPGVGTRVATVNGKTKKGLGDRWPGLDIRGDGGYVLFSGETNRGKYAWLREPHPHPLEAMPDDLREFLGLSDKALPSPEELIGRALKLVAARGRNGSGFWLATQLRDNQHNYETALDAMQSYRSQCPEVNAKGQPEKYTEAEMLATLKQAYDRPAREPWRKQADATGTGTAVESEQPGAHKHFLVTNRAVFKIDEENPDSKTFVCSRLDVLAYARDPNSESWGRLLNWTDAAGKLHSWIVPMRMLVGDGVSFRETLADGGLDIGTGPKTNHLLVQYVRTERPSRYMFCVPHTGWIDRCFVTPESVIPKGGNVGYQSTGRGEHFYRTSGTLAEWRKNVGEKCYGNSRLIFAASAAFAGPVLRPLNIQGGGFHFRSLSSMGKSTAQWIAGSVWGGGGRLGFARTWAATKNAIESIAEIHNDALLILDEIRMVEPRDVEQIVYMLANGSGKARENRNMTGRRTLQWLCMVLSSGEIPLSDCAELAGQRIKGGAEIRMATIPADAGKDMGIFERLHGTDDPRVFAESLERAARLYYGTAIRAFIEWFAAHWDEAVNECAQFIEDFITRNLPSGAAAEIRRVLRRFAVSAWAGEKATEVGVTGWQPGDAKKAAIVCFRAWIKERGGIEATDTKNAIDQVRGFIASQHARFYSAEPIYDSKSNVVREHIPNSAGYWKEIENEPVYLVHIETFRKELCRGFSFLEVARELKKRKLLLLNELPALTYRQAVTLPSGAPGRLRFYAIKAKIAEGEANEKNHLDSLDNWTGSL